MESNEFTHNGVTALYDEDTQHIRYFSGEKLLGMFPVKTDNWINEALQEIIYQTVGEPAPAS